MDWSIVILVVAVAAVAYFVWNQRKGAGGDSSVAAPAAPSGAAAAAPARPAATPAAAGSGALASYDEYRRANPSHMVYNKLTCNRCGSNMIRTSGGTALCGNCGAALYRA